MLPTKTKPLEVAKTVVAKFGGIRWVDVVVDAGHEVLFKSFSGADWDSRLSVGIGLAIRSFIYLFVDYVLVANCHGVISLLWRVCDRRYSLNSGGVAFLDPCQIGSLGFIGHFDMVECLTSLEIVGKYQSVIYLWWLVVLSLGGTSCPNWQQVWVLYRHFFRDHVQHILVTIHGYFQKFVLAGWSAGDKSTTSPTFSGNIHNCHSVCRALAHGTQQRISCCHGSRCIVTTVWG